MNAFFQGMGILFSVTWFIWPFVFVFSLVHAISSEIKSQNTPRISSLIAAISLFIIVGGFIAFSLH